MLIRIVRAYAVVLRGFAGLPAWCSVLALLVVGNVACSSSTGGGPDPEATQALEDVVGWMNNGPPDESTYAARFTPEFVAQVPYDDFVLVVRSQESLGPWVIDEVQHRAEGGIRAIVRSGELRLFVSLALLFSANEPARIAGLLIQPENPFEPPTDRDEAVARLEEQGRFSWLTASTSAGRCEPLYSHEAERVEPLGSTFKLWVLAALLERIDAGDSEWSSPVAIRDALDSLPSGETQNEPDGSELSVRELAERMISISDNTATDHLIDLVGREQVEQALVDTAHSAPEQNQPFLTTRELFILKWGAEEVRERYLAADEAGRRELLASDVASAPLPDLDDVEAALAEGPRDVYAVEWFGSPLDLCRVLLRVTDDSVAREILAINPGVPGLGRWSYLGFKGGSESGVLATAWAHERSADQRFITTAIVSNPDELLNDAEVINLMAALRDLTPELTRQ